MDARDPYVNFTRAEWSKLRASTPLSLSERELEALRSHEPMSVREVEEVYLPLSRLLNLRVAATRELHQVTETFLGNLHAGVPYVIGIAGSVAVGKSTIARMLQALLGRWPDHPRVDLVTTDGFLFSNATLEARGLMARKGFPESYDVRALMEFLSELKAGVQEVRTPRYSHLTYDILPGEEIILRSPDIVIVEGVNVLQTPSHVRRQRSQGRRSEGAIGQRGRADASVVVSDFFDFSIYVDATEDDLERWYVDRLLVLRETSLHDSRSFFNFLTEYSEDATRDFARNIWSQVNLVNLHENIEPTRGRAHLVLEKGGDHAIRRVRLRKV